MSGQKNSTQGDAAVRLPAFCSIEVLYSCILRCKMCYMWKNERLPDELSCGEWKRFLRSLRKFTACATSINITGGEPFLKTGVLELVRCAVDEGFSEVSMTTNGFLIDAAAAEAIAVSGMKMISFSLDSIDAQLHDRIRGVQGAQRRVSEAIDALQKRMGTLRKIGIQTIIMGPTIDGLPRLVAWARTRGISVYFMAIVAPLCLPPDEHWQSHPDHGFLWPADRVRTNAVIDELIRLKQDGADIGNSLAQLRAFKTYFNDPAEFVKKEKKCKMGDGMLKIGPSGEVALCGEKGPIGSIRSADIEKIWFSPQAEAVRRQIAACKTNCPQLINCYFEE